MSPYHIAQANIAEMLMPLDDPGMVGFTSRLEEINALADRSPGFVWRLQDDTGDATSLRLNDNDMLIINMSVWQSIDALYQYTYYSDHVEVFRQRRDWFTQLGRPHLVMWWVPAGHIPTIEEMVLKFDTIAQHGPTPLAFTFKQPFSIEDMLAYQPQ